jgi:hypothetical protein
MYLCYINKLGPNFRNELIYEFIFTNDIDNVSGDDWDRLPASGYPSLPHSDFMTNVLLLKTGSLDLELVKDNDFFTYNDCKEGIVAIGWEESYIIDRLIFKFGDDLESVKDRLYKKDYYLEEIN